MNIKEKINEGYLHCFIIIEIAGKPAPYISDALRLVLKGLSKEKDIFLVGKKIHKPKKVSKVIFSTFAEIELLVKGISKLLGLIFDYMPSSVEITEPSDLKLDLQDANAIVNDLATRLHNYDAVRKRLLLENEILKKQLEEAKKT